ncbi:NUDIX domain-containing protein [Glycomyces luteolus]|uniref:Oxidized purine nucleoside triphosphate hydrolase n=1 Tax=Glycomyces luteolus TaxID=2670330 RepID=A0A9X3PHG7_9ACTN|nr:NUDIX domain-containing protein [Glycomyces luteolus]MDA1362644.1 NUDIX domain-containing protein [Glycomyces luteolus]
MTLTPMCLCLLTRRTPDGRREVLLGRRKKLGMGTGKVVGLGGHVEPDETAAQAAARETAEESGLIVAARDLREAANVVFRFPVRPEWDMRVAVFVGDRFTGDAYETAEIAPRWYPIDDLPVQDMWDDNRYWLPQVLAGQRLHAEFVFAEDCETVATSRIVPAPEDREAIGDAG